MVDDVKLACPGIQAVCLLSYQIGKYRNLKKKKKSLEGFKQAFEEVDFKDLYHPGIFHSIPNRDPLALVLCVCLFSFQECFHLPLDQCILLIWATRNIFGNPTEHNIFLGYY